MVSYVLPLLCSPSLGFAFKCILSCGIILLPVSSLSRVLIVYVSCGYVHTCRCVMVLRSLNVKGWVVHFLLFGHLSDALLWLGYVPVHCLCVHFFFLIGSIHRRGRIQLPGLYYIQYVCHVYLVVILLRRNCFTHCFHLLTHRPLIYNISQGRFVYFVSFCFDLSMTRAVLVYVTLFITTIARGRLAFVRYQSSRASNGSCFL